MALFRCLNCRAEFEAAAPACAPCGLDAAKSPRDAELVVKLETIHFDPPSGVAGRGLNHAACDPRLTLGGGRRFTGEPGSVTCAKCKQTEAYTAADGAANGAIDLTVQKL